MVNAANDEAGIFYRMTTSAPFSQFRAGGEHRGRTATLKAVAYCTGHVMVDERNNRRFDYAGQGNGERILKAGIFLPADFPTHLDRPGFKTEADFQQAVWTSLARFEEQQTRRYGRGGNQPIISRHDVLLLDKRIFLDAEGKPRADGIKHAYQVVTDFLRENYTRKGLVASFSIHDQDGNGNFHVHIVSSYRTLTADGWGERKRPFGKSEWAVWVKQKQSSLFKIQTRKLEALGVIPKAERVSNKRETLTAWKIERGFMTQPTFRPQRIFNPILAQRRISASAPPRLPVMNSSLSFAIRAPTTTAESFEKRPEQHQPVNRGGGFFGGSGGNVGGISDGADFVLSGLAGAVATAEEKLRLAFLTGIGIATAQAALAAAKLNLANHGWRGTGKGQGGAMRMKFRRRRRVRHQNL